MSDHIISELTMKEIVAVYNKMSKIQVQKFKDLKGAQARLHGLTLGNNAGLLKAMKAVKVRPEIIAKYEEELAKDQAKAEAQANAPKPVPSAEPAPGSKAKATGKGRLKPAEKVVLAASSSEEGAVPSPSDAGKEAEPSVDLDPDWTTAATPLLQAQMAEKAKLGDLPRPERKKRPSRQPETLEQGSKAANVLWHLQQGMARLKTKGEDEVMTGEMVARSMSSNNKEVCKQLDLLRDLKYVEIEDDTEQGAKEPFYYVTLTPSGTSWVIRLVDGKPEVSEPKQKGPREPRAPRAAGSAPVPRGDKAGKKIYKLQATNPRREGSAGWKSWNLITDGGMLYDKYIEAGGRCTDLQWDVAHGWAELK